MRACVHASGCFQVCEGLFWHARLACLLGLGPRLCSFSLIDWVRVVNFYWSCRYVEREGESGSAEVVSKRRLVCVGGGGKEV